MTLSNDSSALPSKEYEQQQEHIAQRACTLTCTHIYDPEVSLVKPRLFKYRRSSLAHDIGFGTPWYPLYSRSCFFLRALYPRLFLTA
jgi:hypothetical protein